MVGVQSEGGGQYEVLLGEAEVVCDVEDVNLVRLIVVVEIESHAWMCVGERRRKGGDVDLRALGDHGGEESREPARVVDPRLLGVGQGIGAHSEF